MSEIDRLARELAFEAAQSYIESFCASFDGDWFETNAPGDREPTSRLRLAYLVIPVCKQRYDRRGKRAKLKVSEMLRVPYFAR